MYYRFSHELERLDRHLVIRRFHVSQQPNYDVEPRDILAVLGIAFTKTGMKPGLGQLHSPFENIGSGHARDIGWIAPGRRCGNTVGLSEQPDRSRDQIRIFRKVANRLRQTCEACGRGLQKTNIVKDFTKDLDRGISYLPLTWLQEADFRDLCAGHRRV